MFRLLFVLLFVVHAMRPPSRYRLPLCSRPLAEVATELVKQSPCSAIALTTIHLGICRIISMQPPSEHYSYHLLHSMRFVAAACSDRCVQRAIPRHHMQCFELSAWRAIPRDELFNLATSTAAWSGLRYTSEFLPVPSAGLSIITYIFLICFGSGPPPRSV